MVTVKQRTRGAWFIGTERHRIPPRGGGLTPEMTSLWAAEGNVDKPVVINITPERGSSLIHERMSFYARKASCRVA